MGGGKKGEPGEGKGDEEIDNLLTVTVSEGVVSFVSGPITAEVMAGVLVHVYLELSASLLLSASVDYTAFGRPHFL